MKMRKVVLDENIIPPITHPWGKVWIQPNPKDIILDDEYAVMKQKDFDLLADFNNTIISNQHEYKKTEKTNSG